MFFKFTDPTATLPHWFICWFVWITKLFVGCGNPCCCTKPTVQLQSLIEKFMGPTWSPSGGARTQVGPMLAPWTLLSGLHQAKPIYNIRRTYLMFPPTEDQTLPLNPCQYLGYCCRGSARLNAIRTNCIDLVVPEGEHLGMHVNGTGRWMDIEMDDMLLLCWTMLNT